MAQGLKRKQKEAVKDLAQGQEQPLDLAGKVDRYGELQGKVEELDAKMAKRVAKLREEQSDLIREMAGLRAAVLEEATKGLDDKQGTEVPGRRFFLRIGKRKMQRTITDMKRMAELVGLDNFFALCTFPLKSADDYLNPKEREQVISVSHDGPRSFVVEGRKD